MAKDGLDKLSSLMSGAQSSPPGSMHGGGGGGPTDPDEIKLMKDAQRVIQFATQVAGKDSDIFDVQILVETCAEMVRDQIREEVTGGEGG